MAHSRHSQLKHMFNALTRHAQSIRITNVLTEQYSYAMQTNDMNTKRKIVDARKILYRHKKYGHTGGDNDYAT